MVKVKYVPEINTFGQNIMVKSDQEKINLNLTLSHFHPYSIVTGDGWIRGLKCVKGMKELDKMFYFILHNSRLTYRTWPCSKLVV